MGQQRREELVEKREKLKIDLKECQSKIEPIQKEVHVKEQKAQQARSHERRLRSQLDESKAEYDKLTLELTERTTERDQLKAVVDAGQKKKKGKKGTKK